MGLDSGDPRPAPPNAHPPTAADAAEGEGQLCPPPPEAAGQAAGLGPDAAQQTRLPTQKPLKNKLGFSLRFLSTRGDPRSAGRAPRGRSRVGGSGYLGCEASLFPRGQRRADFPSPPSPLSTAPDFMWGAVSGTVGAGMTPWPPRGHPELPQPESLASERELTMPQTQGPRGDLSSLGTDRQTRGPGHAGHCGGKTLWLPRRPWPPASASSAPGAGSAGCRGLGDGCGDIALRGRHVSPWPWATGTVTVPITMRIKYKPSSLLPEI